MSPFVRRAREGTLPASDRTPAPCAGCACPACGATFVNPQNRNLHYMKRHADRRLPWNAAS